MLALPRVVSEASAAERRELEDYTCFALEKTLTGFSRSRLPGAGFSAREIDEVKRTARDRGVQRLRAVPQVLSTGHARVDGSEPGAPRSSHRPVRPRSRSSASPCGELTARPARERRVDSANRRDLPVHQHRVRRAHRAGPAGAVGHRSSTHVLLLSGSDGDAPRRMASHLDIDEAIGRIHSRMNARHLPAPRARTSGDRAPRGRERARRRRPEAKRRRVSRTRFADSAKTRTPRHAPGQPHADSRCSRHARAIIGRRRRLAELLDLGEDLVGCGSSPLPYRSMKRIVPLLSTRKWPAVGVPLGPIDAVVPSRRCGGRPRAAVVADADRLGQLSC